MKIIILLLFVVGLSGFMVGYAEGKRKASEKIDSITEAITENCAGQDWFQYDLVSLECELMGGNDDS